MMLAIEREWHQLPGWLLTLPREVQATLIADYMERACRGGPTEPGAPK
jgi:hypothetical protein